MPMQVGDSTTYTVTAGLDKYVEPVKVARETAVGGVRGYELAGPLGVSRLAWRGSELIASQTSNATFDPPLPILASDGRDRYWRGKVRALDRVSEASATLRHGPEAPGSKSDRVKATVTLELPRGKIELISVFEPGVGLVLQEQRTGEELVVRLEMLSSGQVKGK